jgi:ketosteroid isomerase-like protein
LTQPETAPIVNQRRGSLISPTQLAEDPILIPLACLVLIGVSTVAFAEKPTNAAIADEVMAMAKAQWAAENATPPNVAEDFSAIADDYTEFNGDYSTRLDGKPINLRLAEAGNRASGRTIISEMANPKVQVYGDTAILSYNFVGLTIDKDGKTEPSRAKSTRVYYKIDGQWKLVHANFAPDPLPH